MSSIVIYCPVSPLHLPARRCKEGQGDANVRPTVLLVLVFLLISWTDHGPSFFDATFRQLIGEEVAHMCYQIAHVRGGALRFQPPPSLPVSLSPFGDLGTRSGLGAICRGIVRNGGFAGFTRTALGVLFGFV